MSEPYQPGQKIVGNYEFRKCLQRRSAFLWVEAVDAQGGDPVVVQVLNPDVEWKEAEIASVIEHFDRLQGVHREGLWTPTQLISDASCSVGLIYKNEVATPLFEVIGGAAEDAARLWKQASELLHHLHNRDLHLGIVSPESFVVVGGKVHLTCFGYEPLLKAKHQAAWDDGSAFLAPEMVSEGEVSNASDIFGYAKTVATWKPEWVNAEWFRHATEEKPANRFQRARQMFGDFEKFMKECEALTSKSFELVCEAMPLGGGEVNGGGEYQGGESVSVEAKPAKSFKFVRWEGDAKGSENPLQVEVGQKMSIVAVFEKKASQRGGLALTSS